jgi:predicted Rossmann-fold nucleotide-binding protein
MLEIDSIDAFAAWLGDPGPAAIQALDLTAHTAELERQDFHNCLFLGCRIEPRVAGHIVSSGGIVIPTLNAFAFDVHHRSLYSPEMLFAGFDVNDPDGYFKSRDYRIYRQFLDQGKGNPSSILVSLAHALHDHSITDALNELLVDRKVVAIMGGHAMERRDPYYCQLAQLSRTLTQMGFLMVSGGGPGAMEATHFGAWFGSRPVADLHAALDLLKQRPDGAPDGKEYADADWLHRAWRVREAFPIPPGSDAQCMSIGIPTWVYGHEPPAPFATGIAKYFSNAIREDGLLAIAKNGIIYAPGSAGTIQEIFQDAAQNHYFTTGCCSPMILFGSEYWTHKKPVWPLLSQLAATQRYGEIMTLTDSPEKIIKRLQAYKRADFVQ